MTSFSDFGLKRPILDTLHHVGYGTPTPIQARAIPDVLAGADLLGIAATGTGKTAAFALPILQRLTVAEGSAPRRACRALVLAPTRELAAQIGESFRGYGRGLGLSVAVIVGGTPFRPQTQRLAKGVDVLVATPGRLLDHLERGTVRLDGTTTLVLDEADHMLDLGFIPAVRRLVRALPETRQTLMFSATMPAQIRALADDFLTDPVTVTTAPPATPAARVDQRLIHIGRRRKSDLLTDLLNRGRHHRVLVFTRTKRGADRVVRGLAGARIQAAAIHGNKSQGQRIRALEGFRSGKAPILVATDIAARGLDVDGIDLVVNFDLPNVAETYVHRIGRTGRAGASGLAVSFCGPDDGASLKAIERLIGKSIGRAEDDPVPEHTAGPAGAVIDQAPAAGPATPKRRKKAHRKGPPPTVNGGESLAEMPFMARGAEKPAPRSRRRRKSGRAKPQAAESRVAVGA